MCLLTIFMRHAFFCFTRILKMWAMSTLKPQFLVDGNNEVFSEYFLNLNIQNKPKEYSLQNTIQFANLRLLQPILPIANPFKLPCC